MAAFIGTFSNKVDRKGRVSVPARYRSALAAQAFAGIVVAPSYELGAIEACDFDRINQVVAGLDRPGLYTPQQKDMVQLVLSKAEELPFDAEGRVMLSPAMLKLAEIGETAMFCGVGTTFQIWNPDKKLAHDTKILSKTEGRPLGLGDLPNPALLGPGSAV